MAQTFEQETKKIDEADRLEVVYYTDPLCCWSWGMEPHWQRIQEEYKEVISLRYCMGGLIESWDNYYDAVNSVSRPIQMGPVWMQASCLTGAPIDNTIWVKDPPASSYLACVAVKCAGIQSFDAEKIYLQMLREAVMLQGLNIARQSILIAIAEKINHSLDFNIRQFKDDLVNGTGFKAFTADLQEVRYKNINRLPTLIISKGDDPGIVITGYRPYEKVTEAIKMLSRP